MSSFLKEAITNLKTVGSVKPSSPNLCRAMASRINPRVPQIIVELGAGEGTITQYILKRMHAESRLFTFEINQHFIGDLQSIDDPRVDVINDSAEHLQRQLKKFNVREPDVIVSSLPLVLFDKELSQQIIDACYAALKKGGVYVQFHYSFLNRKMYDRTFDQVHVKFVLNNLPPAFVFYCRKK